MLFDVYSQTGSISGVLVLEDVNTMLYMNTKITDQEEGTVSNIKSGQSYELVVVNDEPISINFESEHGAGDGVSDAILLQMLCHRHEELLKQDYTEERSLAIRALQMTIDALNKCETKK